VYLAPFYICSAKSRNPIVVGAPAKSNADGYGQGP
jgi:hypothetical protein